MCEKRRKKTAIWKSHLSSFHTTAVTFSTWCPAALRRKINIQRSHHLGDRTFRKGQKNNKHEESSQKGSQLGITAEPWGSPDVPVWCLKCATNFCHQSLHHESCLASFMTDAVNPHSEPPARQRVNARLLISQLIVTVSSFKGWFCQNHHLSSWLMNQCWHTAGL